MLFVKALFMRNRLIRRWLIIPLLISGLLGCQSVSTTSGGAVGIGREQSMFLLLTPEQVNDLSRQSYIQILNRAKEHKVLVSGGAEKDRLQRIGDRIITQVGVFRKDASRWPWQISLISDKTMNASCLPGGRIVFYTGIIDGLRLTDDEIAAVMGHEIAHALREHGREAMSEAYMIQLGSSVAGSVFGVEKQSLDLANQVVYYAMTLPNSREKETEADVIGLELMARAGYNPEAAVTLWQKMAARNRQQPPEFMSTHPATESRISGLKYYIPKVKPLYLQTQAKQ